METASKFVVQRKSAVCLTTTNQGVYIKIRQRRLL